MAQSRGTLAADEGASLPGRHCVQVALIKLHLSYEQAEHVRSGD